MIEMFTAPTVLFVAATYALMCLAYVLPQWRLFHRSVMLSVMAIDLLFPFYLYFNRDWWRRLIEQQEILSFMIWMHLILVITLYILYFFQLQAARQLLRGDQSVRNEHRSQGLGIIITRGLVLVTGALLVEIKSTN